MGKTSGNEKYDVINPGSDRISTKYIQSYKNAKNINCQARILASIFLRHFYQNFWSAVLSVLGARARGTTEETQLSQLLRTSESLSIHLKSARIAISYPLTKFCLQYLEQFSEF